MSPLLMSIIVFACVLGGMVLGMFLRNRLPEHHLSGDTKDVVKLGTGLIGTIAALVLGLLIASANSTFQTQSTQVQQLTADIVLLDRTLAQYGSETDTVRNLLRRAVTSMADRIWRENSSPSRKGTQFEASAAALTLYDDIIETVSAERDTTLSSSHGDGHPTKLGKNAVTPIRRGRGSNPYAFPCGTDFLACYLVRELQPFRGP